MSLRSLLVLASLVALGSACGRASDSPRDGAPEASAHASATVSAASAVPAASASVTASASASASAAPASPPPGAPPLVAITPACCMRDRAEGKFGSERGIMTRYSGDFLRRKDGDRLLFPDDLISDTKERFQHAQSAGRSVTQERRLKVVGEGPRYVSVEIEDRGETGALKPFAHSACCTVDLKTGKAMTVEAVVGKERAPKLVEEARAAFDALPGHEQFRFLPSSFAMIGTAGDTIRFCNPRRAEDLGAARLDVEARVR